jgi:DNA-binding transcriptional MerR regulator
MSSDTNESKIIYTSSDVSTLLRIQESTLRKYALLLSEAGYNFHKSKNGHRGYFERDVIVLKKLIETKNHPDMTLKQACNAVMSWVESDSETVGDTEDMNKEKRYDESYSMLLEEFNNYKRQQEEFNKKLLERLDQQHNYIEKRLEKRDEQLMAALRESQETKKLLLATKEEVEEEKTKSFWSKLFNK